MLVFLGKIYETSELLVGDGGGGGGVVGELLVSHPGVIDQIP